MTEALERASVLVGVSRVAVNRHGHTSLENTGSDSRPIATVSAVA
jgi:hypothetical protein